MLCIDTDHSAKFVAEHEHQTLRTMHNPFVLQVDPTADVSEKEMQRMRQEIEAEARAR